MWTGTAHAHVRFEVRGVECLIPVEFTREVLLTPKVSRIFRSEDFVLGMVNIRGDAVPVLDAGLLLGISGRARPIHEHPMLVVLEIEGQVAALVSDSRVGVIQLDPALVEPPPVDLSLESLDCMVGLVASQERPGSAAILIDPARLLALPRVRVLSRKLVP